MQTSVVVGVATEGGEYSPKDDLVDRKRNLRCHRFAQQVTGFNLTKMRAEIQSRLGQAQGLRLFMGLRGEVCFQQENVRCDLQLETARGERVVVSQITGLIARRIVCHPQVGEWVGRGLRYGLIRFGSRTDVVLPISAELRVRRGEPVRGGSSVIAQLPREA